MKPGFLALTFLLGGATSTAFADYVVIVANLGQGGNRLTANGQLPALANLGLVRPGMPGVPQVPGGVGQPAPNTNVSSDAPFDPDKAPPMVIAVVEVERAISKTDALKIGLGGAIWVRHKVGTPDGHLVLANTQISNVTSLHPDEKAVPPLHKVYEKKEQELKESKTPITADQEIDLAEWALARGMLDHFKEHMEKAVAIDKTIPKAAAYLQMKAAIAKPAASTDPAGAWRAKLLSNRYQTNISPHYVLLQNDPSRADSRLHKLEDSFQSYYYWFALHGLQLPVPQERLVAILTVDDKQFKHLQSTLDATPTVSDAFYAPREGLLVFSSKRLDDAYDQLEKFAAPLWTRGYNRDLLLKGKGYPTQPDLKVLQAAQLAGRTPGQPGMGQPGMPQPGGFGQRGGFGQMGGMGARPGMPGQGGQANQALAQAMQAHHQEIYEAMTLALLLKVMELDDEVAGTNNGATLQLLYASGLLPPSVDAPEWVQFGVSTFFETSPGSPWPTIGLPNFEYHRLFSELDTAGKLPDRLELLKQVVTDSLFRDLPANVDKDAALRKARATAWSLTYFLMRKRLDGLQRYFKELSNMPRDMALDDQTLWLAFVRAFNAVDPNGQLIQSELQELANDWDKDTQLVHNDPRELAVMREIQQAYKDAVTKQSEPPPQTNPAGTPGMPGGIAPGGIQSRPGMQPGGYNRRPGY